MLAVSSKAHLCRLKDLGKFDSSRNVSSKYLRPHPRPYKRRLFEATLAPILPPDLQREQKRLTDNKLYSLVDFSKTHDPLALNPMELFLAEQLRRQLIEEKFRLIVVCQRLYHAKINLWMARNELRLCGIELCDSAPRVIRKALESSPLRTLNQAVPDTTCLLLAKDLESIITVFSQTTRNPWIVPLVVAFDDRILSMEQAKELAKFHTLEELRAQTTQILARIPYQLVGTIQHSLQGITQTLGRVSQAKSSESC